jgi:hypothetical protein
MSSERAHVALRPEQATIPPGHPWNRIPVIGAGCAVLGAAACALLGASNPKQFFFSWLVSFLFFLSLALGGLFFVLIQYATQGGWGIVLRRIGETIFALLPVMAVIFLPLLLGLRDLMLVGRQGAAEHVRCFAGSAVLQRAVLPDPGGDLFRSLELHGNSCTYRGSRGQDVLGISGVGRLRRLAGPAIIVLAVTQDLRFDRLDHVADAALVSTMFGVCFFAGSFVGFIALLSIPAAAMRQAGLLETVISAEHLHDMGKLLFAFTSFWAYIAFSQFFLIWYEPSGGRRFGTGRGSRGPGRRCRSCSWRATSGCRSFT